MAEISLKKEEDILKTISQIEEPSTYQPSIEESSLVERVKERIWKMKEARSEFEDEWEENFEEYRSEMSESGTDSSGFSNIELPLEFQVIEMKLAEEYDNPPRYNFIAVEESDQKKIPIIEKIWEYAWYISNSDKNMMRTQFSRLLHGTSIWFEGWKTSRKKVRERIEKQKESDEVYSYKEKNVVFYDDVQGELVDVRDFFVDELAIDMESARDCARRYYFPDVESFRQTYSGKVYRNVDKVRPRSVTKEILNPEEDDKGNIFYEVEVWEYWNQIEDQLIIVANDIIIRQTPNPYDHKELPFVRFIDHYMEGQFYGLGEVQRLKHDKLIKNKIVNIIIDMAKISMLPPIITDFDSEFDEDEYKFQPGAVWRMGGNAQILTIPDLSKAGYNLEKFLDEDMIATTGIDTKSLIRQASETATKTAVRQESQNKRVDLGLKFNEFDAFKRLGRLRLKNIQQFYSIPVVRRIVERDEMGNLKEKTKAASRRIPVENQTVSQEEGKLIFKDERGAMGSFEVSPEILRGEYDIYVVPGATKPVSQELKKAKAMEAIEILSRVSQIEARKKQEGLPALDINLEEPIKMLAEALGWDSDKMFGESVKQNEVMKQLKKRGLINSQMMGAQQPQGKGMPIPTQPGRPEGTSMQMPAQVMSQERGQSVTLNR